MLDSAADLPIPLIGFLASLIAGLMTGVGALPVLFVRDIPHRAQNVLLGFGAGVMLAATAFSLIVPGVATASSQLGTKTLGALVVAIGILVGGLSVWLGNRLLPVDRLTEGPYGISRETLRRTWLFMAAITLHNFPEGLAVGVGFATGDFANGLTLAVGIGLQNFPEGLAVAFAAASAGYSAPRAFLIGTASGLAEPLGGAFGAGVISLALPLMPFGLAFAAGAMLFVISQEVIPEIERDGTRDVNTFGLFIGFVIMMMLDVIL
jgi:ZIP family zinc transporter